jgi:hypothetical protein
LVIRVVLLGALSPHLITQCPWWRWKGARLPKKGVIGASFLSTPMEKALTLLHHATLSYRPAERRSTRSCGGGAFRAKSASSPRVAVRKVPPATRMIRRNSNDDIHLSDVKNKLMELTGAPPLPQPPSSCTPHQILTRLPPSPTSGIPAPGAKDESNTEPMDQESPAPVAAPEPVRAPPPAKPTMSSQNYEDNESEIARLYERKTLSHVL